MSIRDVVEDIEDGCQQRRYSPETIETAGEVKELFDSINDAAEYILQYNETYQEEDAIDDPVGYAESWHEEFGSIEGIMDSL